AAGAAAIFLRGDLTAARVLASVAALGCAAATAGALAVSVQRRRAGVRGREEVRAARRARVAAMIGRAGEAGALERGPGFRPALDLIAPVCGAPGLLAAAQFAG